MRTLILHQTCHTLVPFSRKMTPRKLEFVTPLHVCPSWNLRESVKSGNSDSVKTRLRNFRTLEKRSLRKSLPREPTRASWVNKVMYSYRNSVFCSHKNWGKSGFDESTSGIYESTSGSDERHIWVGRENGVCPDSYEKKKIFNVNTYIFFSLLMLLLAPSALIFRDELF